MKVKELKNLIKNLDNDINIDFYDSHKQCFDNIKILIRDKDFNRFSLCNDDLYFEGDKNIFGVIKD